MKRFLSIFLITCTFLLEDIKALDIKDFLGDEPLTKKTIALNVLEHFQHDDPKGIPVLEIPDPLNYGQEVLLSGIKLGNPVISGHSEIRLDYVEVDLENVQATLKLRIPYLGITSPYTWGYYFGSVGDANITFTELQIGVTLRLAVDQEGFIIVDSMKPIIEKEVFSPQFTGLSLAHGVAVAVADTFFDSMILPSIQSKVSTKYIAVLNGRFREALAEKRFPMDLSTPDFIVATKIKEKKDTQIFDPYIIPEKIIDLPLSISVKLENTRVFGLSTLHRTDDCKVVFLDNKFYILARVGTEAIRLTTDWSLYSSVLNLGSGTVELLLDSLEVGAEVEQNADIRHPPIARMVDIKLGNIAVRSDGEGRFDYAMEAMINILPNIFKDVLMDRKVEDIIKLKIQKIFNTIDVHNAVMKQLEQMSDEEIFST